MYLQAERDSSATFVGCGFEGYFGYFLLKCNRKEDQLISEKEPDFIIATSFGKKWSRNLRNRIPASILIALSPNFGNDRRP